MSVSCTLGGPRGIQDWQPASVRGSCRICSMVQRHTAQPARPRSARTTIALSDSPRSSARSLPPVPPSTTATTLSSRRTSARYVTPATRPWRADRARRPGRNAPSGVLRASDAGAWLRLDRPGDQHARVPHAGQHISLDKRRRRGRGAPAAGRHRWPAVDEQWCRGRTVAHHDRDT